MPKLNTGILGTPSGKIGDKVFVDSTRYGPHIRKTPAIGKRQLSGLKENYTRTSLLNRLASEINLVITREAPEHKHRDFYFEIQKRLRRQALNNRFALISSLKGMNIHPRYTIDRLKGNYNVMLKTQKTKIHVTLSVSSHPRAFVNTNCYSFEFVLLNWTKTKAATQQVHYSDWIYQQGGNPEFEFSFKKPTAITHWLLCLRQRMGLDGEAGSIKLQGMQFIEAGTTEKKEQVALKKQMEKVSPKTRQQKPEIIRIKPKRMN